jgi:hypothetical protein
MAVRSLLSLVVLAASLLVAPMAAEAHSEIKYLPRVAVGTGSKTITVKHVADWHFPNCNLQGRVQTIWRLGKRTKTGVYIKNIEISMRALNSTGILKGHRAWNGNMYEFSTKGPNYHVRKGAVRRYTVNIKKTVAFGRNGDVRLGVFLYMNRTSDRQTVGCGIAGVGTSPNLLFVLRRP